MKKKPPTPDIIELVRQGDEYVDIRLLDEQARFVADGFWPKLKRTLARVPFTRDLVASYYAATDPATPVYVRAVLLSALAYFIMPADLIPDFLVGFGFTDDAAVLATTLQLVMGHITPEHRARADAALGEVANGETAAKSSGQEQD
jgi:uncharacterized membrane protein YkvA (DUF1232 family)